MSQRSSVVVAILSAVLLVAPAHAASPIEVTACGQEIPAGRTGYLSADLTCQQTTPIGVGLGRAAKLDLRGFTLTGAVAGVACLPVQCQDAWCGPTKSGRCEVFNGTITGTRYDAIVGGKIVMHDLTIVDNEAYGALATTEVRANNVQMVNTRNGVQANRKITVRNSTFDDAPINSGGKALLQSSSVTNAYVAGVTAPRIVLEGSTVTANGTQGNCGQPGYVCTDLFSSSRPKLDGTSACEHSLQIEGPEPRPSWGVCAAD